MKFSFSQTINYALAILLDTFIKKDQLLFSNLESLQYFLPKILFDHYFRNWSLRYDVNEMLINKKNLYSKSCRISILSI